MTARTIEDFYASLPFDPDEFQREAIAGAGRGVTVVVTAPTGSGKTLIAEAAVAMALSRGERAFYTTPIKALSNQKYGDLVAVYGPERVGLLTGDNVINGDGGVVVMTTEVLRNMIYAGSPALEKVGVVILDEVHYLQDRFRGGVWEEVIIHAPPSIQLICLSATVANAEEFAAWVRERRGAVELVVTTHRPIPLEDLYSWKDRSTQSIDLLPTFVARGTVNRPNPKIERALSLERGRRTRYATPNRVEVVEHLASINLLPCIYFIFSRAGCEAAALRLLESGVRLTNADERERIRTIAEEGTAHLRDEDLAALEYDRWVSYLEAGIAPHHAGMVPAFKETVEDLFAAGFLKVVFATETLALGINMPARTVVLEALSKWSGDGHELMTPGDYTQLTGRAGRRGIDTAGFGVVLHSPFVQFRNVADIAAAGSHALRSSFRPTYNMAANLCATYDREKALQLVDSSFAQFQREESQTQAQRTLSVLLEKLDIEEKQARCELGSVDEYRALTSQLPPAPKEPDLVGALRPGDVVDIPGGPRQGRFLVLRRIRREGGGMKLLALGTSGRTVALGNREFAKGSTKVASISLPQPIEPKSRRFLSDALRLMRKLPPSLKAPQPIRPEKPLSVDHPVAACPDLTAHLRAAAKADRTRKRAEELRTELRRAGIGLVEDFEAIERLLTQFGYLEGWTLTPRGERLRFLYNELDLALAESLEHGLAYNLTAPELAAFASFFVYEPRNEERTVPLWPTSGLAGAWDHLNELFADLAEAERRERLPASRFPDPGFALLAYQWASGLSLDQLSGLRLAPGDFVRVSRQLVDLLRQIRDVSPENGETAREALRNVDRGVVAAMGVG